MFRSLVFKLARSKRVGFALASNGLVSLASFMLAISIARNSSIGVFAEFSFAMVSYLFITGLTRAAFTNTALSRPNDRQSYLRSIQRSTLISIVAALGLIVWALLSSNYYLLILGITLPGQVMLDFIRTYNAAAEKPLMSLTLSTVWSGATLMVSIISFGYAVEPILLFATWAISGCLTGFVGSIVSGVLSKPWWGRERSETSAAFFFSIDYLVGAGGAQVTTALLGVLADTRILGAIRGAGTLLGPINLVSTTARSLLLPFLSKDNANKSRQLRSAFSVMIIQVLVMMPLLVLLQFIPDWLGIQLLGETWKIASLAILPMSIDALFNIVMSPALAAHRVAFAGTRTLVLRFSTGIPRPFIVLYCALQWGVSGAAWAMAVVACITSIVWWVSFYGLSRKTAEPTSSL